MAVTSLPFQVSILPLSAPSPLRCGSGVNRELLPVARTVQANIRAAGDLQDTAGENLKRGIRLLAQ